jgi:segregation and condensation protein A
MLTEDYSVRLEAFEGPLDLLLHLITRAEVDVSAISLASITTQYLRHLEQVERIEVEPAGEFLVTAATLIELKSRLLVPPDDESGQAGESSLVAREAENPATTLVKQLLQYKRFRESAARLEERRAAWDRRYPLGALVVPDRPQPEGEGDDGPALDLEDISLFDLVQAYARIAESVVFERLGDHSVVDDQTPIELHAADILERLRDAPQIALDAGGAMRPTLPLRTIFWGKRRGEIIGLFLAVLELVRQRAVRVVQKRDEAEPIIALGDAEGSEASAATRSADQKD